MTIENAIDKLTLELIQQTGHTEDYFACRTAIMKAMTIGRDHFPSDCHEIVALDEQGNKKGEFRSILEASHKLQIPVGSISHVLKGHRHKAHELIFMYKEDYYKY